MAVNKIETNKQNSCPLVDNILLRVRKKAIRKKYYMYSIQKKIWKPERNGEHWEELKY